MARVELTSDAVDDLKGLDGSTRVAAGRALKRLEDEPDKRGQTLGRRSGRDLTTFRKLVVGDRDIRIVYRVEPDGTVCVVHVIATRSDDYVYRLALKRLSRSRDPLAQELRRVLTELLGLREEGEGDE